MSSKKRKPNLNKNAYQTTLKKKPNIKNLAQKRKNMEIKITVSVSQKKNTEQEIFRLCKK